MKGYDKDLIIFGCADYARMLKFYIETDDIYHRKIAAFTVSKEYIKEPLFQGLPVAAFENIETEYPPEQYDIILAVGDSRMNDVRKKIFFECKEKGYTVASYRHSTSIIHSADIGEGNLFFENVLIYPFSKIGCGNLIWNGVMIAHDCTVGDFNTFSGNADACGYVTIGNNCYFGKRCLVNDYVKVADYTYVGAASYVKTDTSREDVIAAPRSETLKNVKSTRFVRILDSMNKPK